MQLHYKALLFLGFFCCSGVYAQDARITIIAPDYEAKPVYLWEEDDFFTKHRTLIDEGVVEKAEITFSVKVNRISKIRIGIDYQYATLFVEPDSSYIVSFPKHDPKDNRTLAWNTQVMLSFIDLSEEDVNAQLMAYSAELDLFFASLLYQDEKPTQYEEIDLSDTASYGLEVAAKFSQRESLEKFNLFLEEYDNRDSSSSSFIKDYKKYANASIAYSLGEKRSVLYDTYLKDASIPYYNPEFALFFADFYANYFDAYNFYPSSEKLKAAFLSSEIELALRELIANDVQTGTKQMQELVLLKGLYDYRLQHTEKDSIIISIVENIASESAYEENKKIAYHYLQKITKGREGSLFPDLQFVHFTGDTLSLASYSGQMIYLQIFASWNSSSIAEMELMNELYKRYNNQVRFVSLSIDPDQEQFFKFVKENRNYKWELGWIGVHPETLNQLSIYTIPAFYLIDSDYNCAEWSALWPSTGIEQVFYKKELEQKEKDKFRFWDDQSNKSKREE